MPIASSLVESIDAIDDFDDNFALVFITYNKFQGDCHVYRAECVGAPTRPPWRCDHAWRNE